MSDTFSHWEDFRSKNHTFISDFSDFIDSVILSKEQLLILGDFNIHVDALNNPDSLRFGDLLDSLGLEQHVTEPTQPKDDLCFPDHLHNTSLANDIGFFFYNKIENICRELDVVEIDQQERENVIAMTQCKT